MKRWPRLSEFVQQGALALGALLFGVGLVWFEGSIAKAQHDPVACGREDDRGRPKDKVACECYREQDPCDKDRPETRACGAFCRKDLCGCCAP
jgi:hypothetical protein